MADRLTQKLIETAEQSTSTTRFTMNLVEVAKFPPATNPVTRFTMNLIEVAKGRGIFCPTVGGPLVIGVPFSVTLPTFGLVAPLTFALTGGALPPGLLLNASTGVISGTPTTSGSFSYTVQVTDSLGFAYSVTCGFTVGGGPPPPPGFLGMTKLYIVNYRELDTASQIAAAMPIHTSYTGRLIATDHTRKWTRWNIPAAGAALMYRQPGKVQPVFWVGNNLYTLNAGLKTDDDLGRISPYYTTYFFVTHDQEMGLTCVDATGERQPIGSGRKLLAYLKAYVAGTGQITITPLLDNLTNAGILVGVRTMAQIPKFDIEWGGGQAQADRIALKFSSSAVTGTDNSFSLQRLTAFLKRAQRLQVRGAG